MSFKAEDIPSLYPNNQFGFNPSAVASRDRDSSHVFMYYFNTRVGNGEEYLKN